MSTSSYQILKLAELNALGWTLVASRGINGPGRSERRCILELTNRIGMRVFLGPTYCHHQIDEVVRLEPFASLQAS